MLVLGITADDKGAQLESLGRRVLEEQGYFEVRANVVGAGGNEIDVSAERRAVVLRDAQLTPLMCEAKAYAEPVNMPTWQKFQGQLLIARTDEATTVGLLIALNGVNGNVAGSLKALKATDRALFVRYLRPGWRHPLIGTSVKRRVRLHPVCRGVDGTRRLGVLASTVAHKVVVSLRACGAGAEVGSARA